MNRSKSLWPSFALLFGSLGIVLCIAAIAVVWVIGARLKQSNEKVFARIDMSLAAARDRVLKAKDRVQESKITADEIGQRVKNWARKESSERLASRVELERRTEQLAANLRQTDRWLEFSGASIQGVQQVVEIASSVGAPVDASMVDPLLERFDVLQRQLKQATETIDAIGEQLGKTADAKALDERIDQVAQFSLRVAVTLGQTDSHLADFAGRIADLQSKAERSENKTRLYIVTAQMCAFLLIAWIVAGQISLCRNGWKALSQKPSAAK